MQMSFHTTLREVILFDFWRVTDWQGVGWSMLGVLLLTALYEGIKCYREHLFIEGTRFRRGQGEKSRSQLLFSKLHLIQTIIHVIQMIIAYFLMLIFMTYNVWLCLAMVVGAGLGYWLFAWEKSNGENTDCCT